jgi:hypothetical protein
MTTENYRGASSGENWPSSAWLDLDALYLAPLENAAKTRARYQSGALPVFMLEDWYEGEHSMTDLQVRAEGYLVAARTSDGQTVIANVPSGSVDMSQAKAWWFNPRNGSSTLIGGFASIGKRTFTAPDGNDWVLVVDSSSARLGAPGSGDL